MQETKEMWVWSLGWEDPLMKEWQPTPVFLPGEPQGQSSMVGCSPKSRKEFNTTESFLMTFVMGGVPHAGSRQWQNSSWAIPDPERWCCGKCYTQYSVCNMHSICNMPAPGSIPALCYHKGAWKGDTGSPSPQEACVSVGKFVTQRGRKVVCL